MLISAHLVGVYGDGVAVALLIEVWIGLSISLIAETALYAYLRLERFASESGAIHLFFGVMAGHYICVFAGIVFVLLRRTFYRAVTMPVSKYSLF